MLIAAMAGAALILTDRADVAVPGGVVHIGDVAHGAGARAAVVIARLPRDGRAIDLSRPALAGLIRRALPGAKVSGADRAGLVTLHAVTSVGSAPRDAIPAPLASPLVHAGDTLTLVSRSGPVTIERPVVALQPGRAGRRLFVRDGDGAVSSITLAGAPK